MLKIGWASRDVSTKEPVGITGQAYERISSGSVDPTTVTVLLMEDGKDQVVFISGDFVSITAQLLKEVKAAVQVKAPEVMVDKILFNATHTHSGPRYQETAGYDYAPKDRVDYYPPNQYRAFLVEQVSDAVAEAFANRKAGSFAYGMSNAAVALHRRATYFNDKGVGNKTGNTFAVNGHGIMYGNTNQEDFAGFEGNVDSTVNLLYTFDEANNLTGAIINIGCPSQCTEHTTFTSADYWNETREKIRAKHGNIYILPQCSAAGDLSPHRLNGKESFLRTARLKYEITEHAEKFTEKYIHEYFNRKYIAEKIAYAFDECLEWAAKEKFSDAPIVHVTKTVPLEAWKVSDAEYEQAKKDYALLKETPFLNTEDPYADFKENTKLSSNLQRCESVIAKYEKNEDFRDTEFHVLKIGELAFTSCPFELYLDFQHRIQARSPFAQTVMVQLCAGVTGTNGYLATKRGQANKGYSAIMYSCSVSPEGGQTLVEETLKELHNIK